MSVSRADFLWDEWLALPVKSMRSADYEASGILTGMKHSRTFFTTARLKAARRLMKIWASTSYAKKFSPGISMITRKNQKPNVKFECPVQILKIPKDLKNSWFWLKGLWGSTGGFYFPKSGYYLTLIISDPKISEMTQNILGMTGLSWSAHRSEFTLRNHEDIMTFLCETGLVSTALKFDSTVMIRSVRNRVNVARNYETANIERSVRAAREQTIMAEKILSEGIFETLPEKLREIIELRMKYPDDTLDELGKKLNPQIKKSAVKYRWKKIQNLIDKFENKF